jgi:hypothetical protein
MTGIAKEGFGGLIGNGGSVTSDWRPLIKKPFYIGISLVRDIYR